MTSVFISHSHQDKETVRKLASDLAAHGIRTWVDEAEIRVGDSLLGKISDALRSVSHVIIVVSENSVKSKWVQHEFRSAFERDPNGAKRILLPVVIDDVEIPSWLSDIKYVKLIDEESYEKGIRELIRAIRATDVASAPSVSELLNIKDLAKAVAKEVADLLNDRVAHAELRHTQDLGSDPALVFVIMSFAADMDPIFEGVQAAGAAQSLRVERVKDVRGDYKITDKIVEMIQAARLVVVDLTHERPNVYFELGYARGLGKTVITTAREGTPLHFDVKDWTCTFYNDSRVLERHLKERFAFEIARAAAAEPATEN